MIVKHFPLSSINILHVLSKSTKKCSVPITDSELGPKGIDVLARTFLGSTCMKFKLISFHCIV